MKSPPEATTYTARWLFPVSGPPLFHGTITVRGDRIERVESHGIRTADVDLGHVAIIPGLVNAHMHLDLTGAVGRTPPNPSQSFPAWLRSVIAYRQSRNARQTELDIQHGLAQTLRFGTTLIGEIASQGQSWSALSEAHVRAVVFYELIGLVEERAKTAELQYASWRQHINETALCRAGVSPHAPYSANSQLWDAKHNSPLYCSHLAESRAEQDLVNHGTGPFVEFLKELNLWDHASFLPERDLIRLTHSASRYLFAHGNYLARELWQDITPQQSIVYCPRTHAAFGHSPHPFREMMRAGVRICIGTDSLASNPDLDPLAEIRFLHQRHPEVSGSALLKMATLAGAEALGFDTECGTLDAGKSADFVVIPLPHEDDEPYELLLRQSTVTTERRTLFRGHWRLGDFST